MKYIMTSTLIAQILLFSNTYAYALDGMWCNKGEKSAITLYEQAGGAGKDKAILNMDADSSCLELKTIDGDAEGKSGVGRLIKTVSRSPEQKPVHKTHPNLQVQTDQTSGYETVGMFSYVTLPNGDVFIKTLDLFGNRDGEAMLSTQEAQPVMRLLWTRLASDHDQIKSQQTRIGYKNYSQYTSTPKPNFDQRWEDLYAYSQTQVLHVLPK